MATNHERKILPAHQDPIRIVPMHLGPKTEAVEAPPTVDMTYRQGPLLQNVEVFTIFWGKGWEKDPAAGYIARINDFFTSILGSELLDQLSEYSVPGKMIGHGKLVGTITLTSSSPHKSTSDTAIQHMLQHQISTNSDFPEATANTLYFVYVQPGSKVVQGGSASCQAFCGYHNDISGQIFYAVMPYPSCQGCLGGMDAFASLTSTSSHELCEAITDPIPGQGWYDDSNGEIGDICAWQTRTIGEYTVQLEWSNKAGKCV